MTISPELTYAILSLDSYNRVAIRSCRGSEALDQVSVAI